MKTVSNIKALIITLIFVIPTAYVHAAAQCEAYCLKTFEDDQVGHPEILGSAVVSVIASDINELSAADKISGTKALADKCLSLGGNKLVKRYDIIRLRRAAGVIPGEWLGKYEASTSENSCQIIAPQPVLDN